MFLLVPHVLNGVANLRVLQDGVLSGVDSVGPELPGVVHADHSVKHRPLVYLLGPA